MGLPNLDPRVRTMVGHPMTGKRRRVSPHAKLLKQARPHYDWLLNVQGGVCAICGNPPATRRLDIDHCHKDMYVRGLLCHRCNRALPTHVTADWMRKAIRYLEQPPIRLPEEPAE